MSFIDMTGQRFGRLIALKRGYKEGSVSTYWLCKCDCGTEKLINGQHLRRGLIVSCGCHGRTVALKHGKQGTPTYTAWNSMRTRCGDYGRPHKHWGGRGIKVCERWKSFENFLADMGERPAGMSLERINNDGDYEPGNCRWATRLEQMQNTRANRNLSHEGRTLSLSAWAREKGLSLDTIISRLRRKWSVAQTLDTPPLPTRNRKAKHQSPSGRTR